MKNYSDEDLAQLRGVAKALGRDPGAYGDAELGVVVDALTATLMSAMFIHTVKDKKLVPNEAGIAAYAEAAKWRFAEGAANEDVSFELVPNFLREAKIHLALVLAEDEGLRLILSAALLWNQHSDATHAEAVTLLLERAQAFVETKRR
jgi:hypothetical protein